MKMTEAPILILLVNCIVFVATMPLVKHRVYPQVCLTSSDCEAVNQMCARMYLHGYGHCFAKEDSKIVSLADHKKDKTYLTVRSPRDALKTIDLNRITKDQHIKNLQAFLNTSSGVVTPPSNHTKRELDETLPKAFTMDENTILQNALMNGKTKINEEYSVKHNTEDQISEEDLMNVKAAVRKLTQNQPISSGHAEDIQSKGRKAKQWPATRIVVNGHSILKNKDTKNNEDWLNDDQTIRQADAETKTPHISKKRSLDLDLDLDTAMENLVLVNGSYLLRPKMIENLKGHNTTVEMKGKVDVKVTHHHVGDKKKRPHEAISTISPVALEKALADFGAGTPGEEVPYVEKVSAARVDYSKLTDMLDDVSNHLDTKGEKVDINSLKTRKLTEPEVDSDDDEKNNKRVHKPIKNVFINLNEEEPKPQTEPTHRAQTDTDHTSRSKEDNDYDYSGKKDSNDESSNKKESKDGSRTQKDDRVASGSYGSNDDRSIGSNDDNSGGSNDDRSDGSNDDRSGGSNDGRRSYGSNDDKKAYGSNNDKESYGSNYDKGPYGSNDDRSGGSNDDRSGGSNDDRFGGSNDGRRSYGSNDDKKAYGSNVDKESYGSNDDRSIGSNDDKSGGSNDDRYGGSNDGRRSYGSNDDKKAYGSNDDKESYGSNDDRESSDSNDDSESYRSNNDKESYGSNTDKGPYDSNDEVGTRGSSDTETYGSDKDVSYTDDRDSRGSSDNDGYEDEESNRVKRHAKHLIIDNSENDGSDRGSEEHKLIKRGSSFVTVKEITPHVENTVLGEISKHITKRDLSQPSVDIFNERYRYKQTVGELTAKVYNLDWDSDRFDAHKYTPTRYDARRKRSVIELSPAYDDLGTGLHEDEHVDIDELSLRGPHEENLSNLFKEIEVATMVPISPAKLPESKPEVMWSECSVTCGLGVRQKLKHCSDSGHCSGEGEVKPCMMPICS